MRDAAVLGTMRTPQHPTVHLLIDMVNPLDFPTGHRLLEPALAAARNIAALKQRLRTAGIPTVYVNDNFGRWQLGFRELVELYRTSSTPGAALLPFITPDADDHFVLKPKHSGFYATSLEVLLMQWGARRLILTGIQGNICVMFTADDAHMREYEVIVPANCIACEDADWQHFAVRQLREVVHADIRPSEELVL